MISVIIHHSINRERFLEEALQSVLNQSKIKYIKEIIIVENTKSTKKTKTLKTGKRLKIKHVKLKSYIEPTYKLTLAGLKHAREKYVAYLADDDLWDENHIAKAIESLTLDKRVAASFSATIYFKNNGRYWMRPEDSFTRYFACTKGSGHKMFFTTEDITVGSLLGPIFHYSTLVVKKDVFYKAVDGIRDGNPFDTDRIIPLEIAKYGLVIADSRPGAFIRRHDSQESARIYSSGEGQKWWEKTTSRILDYAKGESINLRVAFAARLRSKNITLNDLYHESNAMGQVTRLIKEGILVSPKTIIKTNNINHPKKNLIHKLIDYRLDRKIIRPIEQIVKKARNYIKNAA
jgi:glycosyltransferase involved in cell wall biosynthesis